MTSAGPQGIPRHGYRHNVLDGGSLGIMNISEGLRLIYGEISGGCGAWSSTDFRFILHCITIHTMHPTWSPPNDYQNRPVAVLGAGVLGRRIGESSQYLSRTLLTPQAASGRLLGTTFTCATLTPTNLPLASSTSPKKSQPTRPRPADYLAKRSPSHLSRMPYKQHGW